MYVSYPLFSTAFNAYSTWKTLPSGENWDADKSYWKKRNYTVTVMTLLQCICIQVSLSKGSMHINTYFRNYKNFPTCLKGALMVEKPTHFDKTMVVINLKCLVTGSIGTFNNQSLKIFRQKWNARGTDIYWCHELNNRKIIRLHFLTAIHYGWSGSLYLWSVVLCAM